MASGRIGAGRIQDITRQVWYEYDNPAPSGRVSRVWYLSGTNTPQNPSCTGNKAFYIALYVINTGSRGNITLRIRRGSDNVIIATKTQNIAQNAGFGLEYNGTMPSANYPLIFQATP